MSAPGWVDSHCHLAHERVEAEAVLAEARRAGVVGFVTIGCDVADSRNHLEIARTHDHVVSTAGVHPHEAQHGIEGLSELVALADVVAVGEAGLDYHYDHSPRDAQREVFAAQVAMAHEHGKPLVIHSRSAWDDTFDVLAAEGVPTETVFHCFTGGPTEARRALDLGAHLSFSGIVTFPSAPELREAAVLCPLDRLLVETDSPYLAPVPHRGKPNRPAWVAVVGEAVAEVRGEPADLVAEATSATTRRIFSLL
ncbi:MAG: TatD family hydrolase [Actinomycetota bacterium]